MSSSLRDFSPIAFLEYERLSSYQIFPLIRDLFLLRLFPPISKKFFLRFMFLDSYAMGGMISSLAKNLSLTPNIPHRIYAMRISFSVFCKNGLRSGRDEHVCSNFFFWEATPLFQGVINPSELFFFF